MYHIIELAEVMSSKIASRNTITAIVFTIIWGTNYRESYRDQHLITVIFVIMTIVRIIVIIAKVVLICSIIIIISFALYDNGG